MLSQESLVNEAVIAINGPAVVHADDVIKEATSLYWSKAVNPKDRAGHYIRRSEKILSYTVSKTVDSLVKVPVKFPFMK